MGVHDGQRTCVLRVKTDHANAARQPRVLNLPLAFTLISNR